jgi:predicted neutral ceramidase superfamily lipid hydrolase
MKKEIKLTLKTKLYIVFKATILLSVMIGVYGVVLPQYTLRGNTGDVILGICFVLGFTIGVFYYIVKEYRSYKRTGEGVI